VNTMAELAQTDREGVSADDKPKNTVEFMAQARKRFSRAASMESMNRKEALDDIEFKRGNQWPADIRAERTISKRPCLTINKMKTFVHQITNDQRQNRPAINISPVGDKADPNTAKMLKGLIRQIERQSNADMAYDTGFESAVSMGWGYWRILTEYEDDDTFDQCIRIGRIRNPFRVYLDPDHESPDGSDAKWCFLSDMITREQYKEDYPNHPLVEWQDGGLGDEYSDWCTQSHVRIAEYFYFKTKARKLVHLENGHVGYEDELAEEIKLAIKERPQFVVKSREVQEKQVMWDTINAHDVLQSNEWAGKWIPVVKVIGDETDIEGKVHLAGMIRDAKDPQRMKNYWATAKTELVALAPKAPWIMEEGQVEGHEQRWQQSNVKSYPYLLYKGTNVAGKPAPAPQRQPFAGPPTGVIEAEQSAEQDMMATTGIRFDATKSERTQDESGKALRELRKNADLASFHYIDNLARSLRHTGRILIDLIPKIYDTPRVLTILREDDSEETVKIEPQLGVSHQTKPGSQGKVEQLYNPKLGDYDVAVTIGPSYATKRMEAADSMMQFMKTVPQSAPIIGDLIAKNMDWPGAEEISERLASQLPPNLLQKNVDNFPPEAKALIGSMTQQLQQLQQENQQAKAMLGDKEADREILREKNVIALDKVQKDFEAKLTDIVSKMETSLMGMVKGPVDALGEQVTALEHKLEVEGAAEQAEEGANKKNDKIRRGDMDKLGEMVEHVKTMTQRDDKPIADSLSAMAAAVEKLSKPKKRTIKGPSGRTFEMSEE
jgi:hypothetical protein